ncbi:MAG: class I SAM-dependent methyltransferase [Anaerolineales bacterium]|nr:class I SAM-dependent methyltransferase [Anaerolineales bacterium]
MRDALSGYGKALADYYWGNTDVVVTTTREDGYISEVSLAPFFTESVDLPEIESIALTHCRGHILDVGAGAGRHSLILQQRGLEVCAIDIIPQAVEIMQARGVLDARLVDVNEFEGGSFDTLLMLMHGIGMVETLEGLDAYLKNVRRLLKPSGQLLVDSLDVRNTDTPEHLAYHERLQAKGRYYGEVRMQFSYQEQAYPLFGWLHVDPETFAIYANQQDWQFEILHQEENGDYLAKLTERV